MLCNTIPANSHVPTRYPEIQYGARLLRRLEVPSMKKFGGFFPLQPELPACQDSVWNFWHTDSCQSIHLRNARSVFSALADGLKPEKIWLPSFLCDDVTDTLKPKFIIRYYDAGANDAEDVAMLSRNAAAGDMVIGVDYFGHPPSASFLQLVKERTDLVWIEDRAHAIDPGVTWGDWLVYSPRKLFGVTDGGIGICLNAERQIEPPKTEACTDYSFMLPALARYEDKTEDHNAAWYELYQREEKKQADGRYEMSRLSKHILQCCSIALVSQQRRKNAEKLYERLRCRMVYEALEPTFVPGGVPILTRNKTELVSHLAGQGIYLATHWPRISAPASLHPAAHDLSRSILTVPCDQRYDDADMAMMAASINDAVSRYDR